MTQTIIIGLLVIHLNNSNVELNSSQKKTKCNSFIDSFIHPETTTLMKGTIIFRIILCHYEFFLLFILVVIKKIKSKIIMNNSSANNIPAYNDDSEI